MQKVTDHSTQGNVTVKKTQDQLKICAADGTTTTLTFHFVAVSGWGGDGRDDGVLLASVTSAESSPSESVGVSIPP